MLQLLYQINFHLYCRCKWNLRVAQAHILHVFFLIEADFLIGKKIQLPNFRNALKERGTVQMLTVSREAAMEVQVVFYMFSLHFIRHITL